MKSSNRIEEDLNAIRIDLYERTKGMTAAEITAYLKKQVQPTLKEFGIQTPIDRADHQHRNENM